ncbi:hypothetical protein ACIHCQ_27410 [Streptomyces sp. NPDC052236]|uniref:hypothetical protein n=1 Tax=Streptomyces sp. NPDC052236 TaxID=3365686 RepID=UPI0037CD1B0B
MTTRRPAAAGADQAPKVLDMPVGLHTTGTRRETDSTGSVDVPADGTGVRRPSGL